MKSLVKIFFIVSILSLTTFADSLKVYDSYIDAMFAGIKGDKNVVLFIESDFCPWCKKMKKTTLSNSEVINLLNKKYIFLKLNKDTDFIPEQFIPNGVPTTYVIDPKVEESIFSLRGYKSASSFLSRLK